MWTGHWGPSFILKTLTPEVPLAALFFAASLPDFTMFIFVILGIEKMELANYLPGAFRYIGNVPLTHSLFGEIILALAVGGAYYMYTKNRLGATSLFLAALSHFPLEIPQHRKDLRIFPADEPTLGFGLFDSYVITFILEAVVVGYSYFYYTSKTTPIPKYKKRSDQFTQYLGIALAVQHIMFTLFLVPQASVRLVHAPLFLAQIIGTTVLAHVVDLLRVDTNPIWNKVEGVKRSINTNKYTRSGVAGK